MRRITDLAESSPVSRRIWTSVRNWQDVTVLGISIGANHFFQESSH